MSLMCDSYGKRHIPDSKIIKTDRDIVLKEADSSTVIIQKDEEYIGFIQYSLFHKDLSGVIYIPDMELLNEYRGMKHGSHALDLFESYLKDIGCKAILVEDANKIKNIEAPREQSFWEQRGYRELNLCGGILHGKVLCEGYDIQAQFDREFNR